MKCAFEMQSLFNWNFLRVCNLGFGLSERSQTEYHFGIEDTPLNYYKIQIQVNNSIVR